MFDIGFSEVLLIFGLALVVLGPDKLPGVARTIGRWAGRARAMARQFRDQLETEADGLKVDLNTPPHAAAPAEPAAANAAAATATAQPAAELPATPDPTSTPTGAIRGMINMLQSLRKEVHADYVACVFDAKGPTRLDAVGGRRHPADAHAAQAHAEQHLHCRLIVDDQDLQVVAHGLGRFLTRTAIWFAPECLKEFRPTL